MLQKPETISCANPYLQAGQDQNEFYYPAVELLPHHCTGKTKATGKTCVLQTFFHPIKSNFYGHSIFTGMRSCQPKLQKLKR